MKVGTKFLPRVGLGKQVSELSIFINFWLERKCISSSRHRGWASRPEGCYKLCRRTLNRGLNLIHIHCCHPFKRGCFWSCLNRSCCYLQPQIRPKEAVFRAPCSIQCLQRGHSKFLLDHSHTRICSERARTIAASFASRGSQWGTFLCIVPKVSRSFDRREWTQENRTCHPEIPWRTIWILTNSRCWLPSRQNFRIAVLTFLCLCGRTLTPTLYGDAVVNLIDQRTLLSLLLCLGSRQPAPWCISNFGNSFHIYYFGVSVVVVDEFFLQFCVLLVAFL